MRGSPGPPWCPQGKPAGANTPWQAQGTRSECLLALQDPRVQGQYSRVLSLYLSGTREAACLCSLGCSSCRCEFVTLPLASTEALRDVCSTSLLCWLQDVTEDSAGTLQRHSLKIQIWKNLFLILLSVFLQFIYFYPIDTMKQLETTVSLTQLAARRLTAKSL